MAFASYKSVISGKVKTELKYPIFLLNNNGSVNGRISSISNNYFENFFSIYNYLEEENIVSETGFEYTIKIIPSTINFPVKYTLIDLEKDSEIALNSELETPKLILKTNKENHNYKLIVEWDLDNICEDLEENLNVEILVKGVQKE